jgi:hypothetical protein
VGVTSWREQIDRALGAIDHFGESKYQVKREQSWQLGTTRVGSVAGAQSTSNRGDVCVCAEEPVVSTILAVASAI